MGHARSPLSCIISSPTTQRPEDFYGVVSTFQQYLRPERVLQKKLILTIRAIMIGQQIDVVVGDFGGTAWRCSNRDKISTVDEAFAECALPTLPGPTPLWGPGSIPNNSADVCGSLSRQAQIGLWKVRMHGAFSHPTKNSRPASNRSKFPS